MNDKELEPRIAVILANPNARSTELSGLIAEVDDAAATADEAVAAARDRAIDLVAAPDAAEAHQQVIGGARAAALVR